MFTKVRKEWSKGLPFIIDVHLSRQVKRTQMFPANHATGSGFYVVGPSTMKAPPECSCCQHIVPYLSKLISLFFSSGHHREMKYNGKPVEMLISAAQ